jgi:hypothetical protein
MTPKTETADVAQLVEAMLEFTAPIAQALDHMARAPARPEPGEIVAVLKPLLCQVLEPLGTVLAPRDLRTTTAVLEATVPLIVDSLYLVPHESPALRRDPRAAHRARRRQRSRKRRDHA